MIQTPRTDDHRTSDFAAWMVLVFLAASVGALQWRSPLPVETSSLLNLCLACAALSGVAIFHTYARPEPRFASMCVGLMQVLLFSALGAVLSYLLARESGVLWDDRLSAWDRALGFDWLAYVRLVDRSAWLTLVLRLAYMSLIPQVIALVLVLGFTGRMQRLRVVLLAAMLSGTVTVLLSTFFPAVSNFVKLGLTAADFAHVNPHAGYLHLADFTALRTGTMAELRLTEMQGIITFPSYHAGLATVTLWGFGRSEVRWFRSGGVTVALLTLFATPVDGGHYLVDVIAGMIIGAASIAAAQHLVRWSPQARLRASPFRRSRAASAP